jgi:bacillithiol biosynthesis cysteine-adding enzyme BshC
VSDRFTIRAEALGGSALSRAARAGELPEWYRTPPRGDEWHAYVASVRASVSENWHDDLAPAFGARGRAAERLARSAGGRGIVVTTGQQPGLFGGPLMTFIKALSARALADALEQSTGVPVAPVFWAATDDADFDEASVVSVALETQARALRLTKAPPAGTPMAAAPMDGAELEQLARVLHEASGSVSHPRYLELVARTYRGGETVGGAYVALLRELLEPYGVAVLDASHPSVCRTAAPILTRVAHDAERLASAVRARDEAIAARGFHPQVEAVEGLSLVFANEHGIKRRLPIDEAVAFRGGDGAFLSPTVLVRPAMERAILPTAAYLGGPGEVAYFAQVNAVAEALQLPIPLVLPRWSATIVEPRVARILDGFGAGIDDLVDPHALETRVARAQMPEALSNALRALRTDLAADVESLRAVNDGIVAEPVLDGLHRDIGHKLDRLERRFRAGMKRREADAMRRIAAARASLFPHGARQERRLAYVVFLARYGAELIDALLEGAGAHARTLVSGTPALAAAKPPAPASV